MFPGLRLIGLGRKLFFFRMVLVYRGLGVVFG